MNRAPLDALAIFRALSNAGVEYVVVGGLAVQTHGHVRMTNDADIVPAPDPGNLGRLAAALNSLDAHILNPGHEDDEINAQLLPRAALWQFSSRHGDIDVLHEAPGMPRFTDLRKRLLMVRVDDVDIPIAGRDDIIAMKRASGRAIDLEDVAALTQQH